MTIREYILAVAKEQSFSRAAKRLFISQPALSQMVIKYEKEIGVTLFDRGASPIRLTEAGEAYVKAANEIEDIEEQLGRYFSDLSGLHTGKLSIGGTFFISSCFLPYFISEYLNRYSGISVNLIEGTSQKLEEMVLDGQLDILVDSKRYDESLLTGVSLMEDHILLAVPMGSPIHQRLSQYALAAEDIISGRHLLLDCPSVPLAEFQQEPFLLLSPGNNMYERAVGLCRRAGFEPKVKMYFNQLMITYYMTVMGVGASFVTSVLVKYSNFHKHPVYYKIADEEAVREIVAVYKRNRYITKAMEAFFSILHMQR